MKLTTDWIRAFVSGSTVDGRKTTPEQVQAMASSYDMNVYAALIWVEHLRSIDPNGLFAPLGRVVDVKAEQITGESELLNGEWALYVKLEPHPDLVAMVREGRKLFLSIEMIEKFPKTGAAYLMGIAVTDSPASLGTQMMEFSRHNAGKSSVSEPLPLQCSFDQVKSSDFDLGSASAEKSLTTAFNVLNAAMDELKNRNAELLGDVARYKQTLEEKDAEIMDLKNQLPYVGYVPRPLSTGREKEFHNLEGSQPIVF